MSKQQIFFTKLIILLSSILCTNIIFAQTLIYKNSISGKDFNSEIVFTKVDNGYFVKATNNKNKIEHIYNTDSLFSVLKWKYSNPENGTDISAERSGNTISITGQLKDEKYEETLKINQLPWYQEWGLGLKVFLVSDKNSTYFWSINPNDLKITKFEANKEKIETIEVNGRKIESVYVKISLTGFMKLLWSADMWFRKSDGTFIYSKMKQGPPTAPVTITQLITEK